MRTYKTFESAFDKVEQKLADANGRLTDGGVYSINYSNIATIVIQMVGRFAERYASDFLINWKNVDELLTQFRMGRHFVMFGISECGVDGNEFVMSRLRDSMDSSYYGFADTDRAGYRKLLALEMRFNEREDGTPDEGYILMTLKDLTHSVSHIADEDIPCWDTYQQDALVRKIIESGDDMVAEFLGNHIFLESAEELIKERIDEMPRAELLRYVQKLKLSLPGVNYLVMAGLLKNAEPEVTEDTTSNTVPTAKKLGKNFYEVEEDPFEYFSNACGDLFVYDKNNSAVSVPNGAHLPFELQAINAKFWSEGAAGLLNYLVRNSITNEYGLLLRCELMAAEADSNSFLRQSVEDMKKMFGSEMSRIWGHTCLKKGKKIADVLAKYAPSAKVYIGKYTGIDFCHNLDFFIPASLDDTSIAKAICLLTSAFEGAEITAPTEVSEEQVEKFLRERVAAVSDLYRGESDTDFFVRFMTAVNKPIMCARISPCEFSNIKVDSDTFCGSRVMENAYEAVREAAKKAGREVDCVTAIRYALSAIAPFHWKECEESDIPTAGDADVQNIFIFIAEK